MKKFLEELRGAKRIELFAVVAAIAMLVLSLCGESGTSSGLFTSEELRLSGILESIAGAGRVEVMLSSADSGGVLIVTEGAENIEVCLRLQYAAETLTGADASEIEIIPYGK